MRIFLANFQSGWRSCIQVRNTSQMLGCLESPDAEIWNYARENGFLIVTADADFFDFASNLGPPPQVIWLRSWDHPTKDAEAVLRREAIRITEFAKQPEVSVLVLYKRE